jgi:hypothetical protein
MHKGVHKRVHKCVRKCVHKCVRKCVHKLYKNFEQILLRAPINFEEQNKVLEPSVIITNYCIIIIINTRYNHIILT